MRRTFIPLDIQCYWCNGHMKVGTTYLGSGTNQVTYFCKDCGAVSNFAVNHEQRIKSIEVTYNFHEEE